MRRRRRRSVEEEEECSGVRRRSEDEHHERCLGRTEVNSFIDPTWRRCSSLQQLCSIKDENYLNKKKYRQQK